MNFPIFRKINTAQGIDAFAASYSEYSGFNVPREYYASNLVFGVYCGGRMIAGFVLGSGHKLRTLDVFAATERRGDLYQKIGESGPTTEMCCFWIAPDCRKKTGLNFFVWACVAYALQVYGAGHLIFGTHSARLAALYGQASKSSLLHTDYINHKRTFIFHGPRRYCLLGVAEILIYKAKRLMKINENRRIVIPQIAN